MASIRGSRAAPGMLDAIRVKVVRDGHARTVPLRDVSRVSVRNAQLLVVNPFSDDVRQCLPRAIPCRPVV